MSDRTAAEPSSTPLPQIETAPRVTGVNLPADAPLKDRVALVVNLMRPAVQSDGGDLELVDVSAEGVVKIRFHGACVGCPSSNLTLQMGLERNLKEHVPEVSEVKALE